MIEKLFTKKIQPIGQKLINIIIQIKSKIKIVSLKRVKLSNLEESNIRPNILNISSVWLNIIFYKIDLFMVINKNIAKLAYFSIFFWTLWLSNPYPSQILSYSFVMFFNISYVLTLLIFISLFLPVKDFGKIDIYGKNNVAYKYRLFFNNISNKKMYYLFKLDRIRKL